MGYIVLPTYKNTSRIDKWKRQWLIRDYFDKGSSLESNPKQTNRIGLSNLEKIDPLKAIWSQIGLLGYFKDNE